MSRIDRAFKSAGRTPLLIPFFTVGDPDCHQTAQLVLEAARQGADLIELGLPYSDPVADGPTIQAASQRALSRGTRISDAFAVVRAVREHSQVPLVLFTYCNPVLRHGAERFVRTAAEAGVDGLLMPDLPMEEATELRSLTRAHGLSLIFLVSPTSPPGRVAAIAQASTGFLYLVAATGVTGMRSQLDQGLKSLLDRVKAVCDLPIAVGFGISSREQAQAIANMGAQGIVVGSAIVERVNQWASSPELLSRVGALVADLKSGLDLAYN